MSENRKRKGEDQAILALASGAHVRTAADSAGISEGTLHRWLKDDTEFRSRVESARDEFYRASFAKLVAVGEKAVSKLASLLDASSEQVQLGAARAILEHMAKGRENVELAERIRQLEQASQAN